jgi:hypothetical protein
MVCAITLGRAGWRFRRFFRRGRQGLAIRALSHKDALLAGHEAAFHDTANARRDGTSQLFLRDFIVVIHDTSAPAMMLSK